MEAQCECGATEGQFHDFDCRFELCPFCEELFGAGCDCSYELLGLRCRDHSPEHHWLPEAVFRGGLSAEESQRWLALISAKGRLPYVSAPQLCGRRGGTWPDFFMVQAAVWEYYAGPALRKAILCEACFHELRKLIDNHQPRPAWLADEGVILRFIRAWKSGDRETLRELEPQKFQGHYPGIPALAPHRSRNPRN